MNQEKRRILLVDDHTVVREGLRAILESSGDIECWPAESAESALALLERGPLPNVVLLDVSLPGMNGFDALAKMRELWPPLAVLMLSMHLEEHYAVRALRLGAMGYLNKSAPTAEVLSAVRAVMRGENYLSRRFAARLAKELTTDSRPRHELLSNREFEVLRLIGSGKPVSEIATMLGLSVKTVSTYRERVLEKMGFSSNFELVRYVLQEGLID